MIMIRELFEPGPVRTPVVGLGGFLTADLLHGALEWIVLVGTAFVVCTHVLNWVVKRRICRPRDGKGPCTDCHLFGRWLCPGPRLNLEIERVENKYD